MPLPKKKRSKARTGSRQAHRALKKPQTAKCSHCGQPHRPHAVCSNCGYYRGRMVVYVQK